MYQLDLLIQTDNFRKEFEININNMEFKTKIFTFFIQRGIGKLDVVDVIAIKKFDDISIAVKSYSLTQHYPVPCVVYKCQCEAKYINWLGIGPEDCSECRSRRDLTVGEIETIKNKLTSKYNEIKMQIGD